MCRSRAVWRRRPAVSCGKKVTLSSPCPTPGRDSTGGVPLGIVGEGAQGVNGCAANADLEVEVRSRRVTGCADAADANSFPDPDTDADVDSRQVCVHRALAAAVRDDDEEPPPAVAPAGPDDLA